MNKVVFGTFMGEIVEESSFKNIENLILNNDISYWESGSGQSLFEYKNLNNTTSLYLSASEDYGFYLEYCKDDVYYVISNGDKYIKVTDIYIGGDLIPIPQNMFINKRELINQIKHFYETGMIDDTSCKWIEKSKVNWDYGEDSNAKEYNKLECSSFREFVIKNSKIKRKWMK